MKSFRKILILSFEDNSWFLLPSFCFKVFWDCLLVKICSKSSSFWIKVKRISFRDSCGSGHWFTPISLETYWKLLVLKGIEKCWRWRETESWQKESDIAVKCASCFPLHFRLMVWPAFTVANSHWKDESNR